MTAYTWDPRGPLASMQRPGGAGLIEYVLDPAGRRIGRKVGGTLERGWLYGGGLLPVAETDADGSTVRRVFVYATRGHVPDLVRQREGDTWVTYRVLMDHLGSVRAVVNTVSGQVVQRMDYDAFGRVVEDEAAAGWERLPFGYAGGLYDRDTGLVRFGAREYDARLGRWVSRDPILFGGGDTNLYRYCGGDPVNRYDPLGLFDYDPGNAQMGLDDAQHQDGAMALGAGSASLGLLLWGPGRAALSIFGTMFGAGALYSALVQRLDTGFSSAHQPVGPAFDGGSVLVCRGQMESLPNWLGNQHYWVVTPSGSTGFGGPGVIEDDSAHIPPREINATRGVKG